MSLKILVVDDLPEDRKAIADILRQEEAFAKYTLRVLEAGDGEEGVAIFAREQPDLVVTDLLMPKFDGFYLCHGVRDLPAGRDVPILVMSGVYKDVAVAKQLRDNFGAELLAKPIQVRRFVAKVLSALNRTTAPVELESWKTQTAAHAAIALPPAVADAAADDDFPAESHAADAHARSPARRNGAVPPVAFDHPCRGTLDRQPLGWLLVQAAAAEVTGTFKLARGKVRKVINVKAGKPIYVDSNLRNETLGSYLVSRGALTEEQLAKAMKQARATSKKLGETLVALQLIDDRAVVEALHGQVRLKLIGALRWPDGAFAWLPGDDFSHRVPHCAVDSVELSLSALKRLVRAEEVSADLHPLLDQGLRLTALGERFRHTVEGVFGASTLRRLLAAASLRQALGSDLDLASVLVEVAAMRQTGLAEFAPPDGAPASVADAVAAQLELPTAPPPPLRRGGGPVVGGALGPQLVALDPEPGALDLDALPSAGSALLELRDLDPTIPRTRSAVIELSELELMDPGGDEPPAHVVPEDSGVLNLPPVDDLELEEPGSGAHSVSPPSPPLATVGAGAATPMVAISDPQSAEQLREILRQTYGAVHDKSFYQILDVPAGASAPEIDAGYRRALERFSSQRFQGVELGAEDEKLAELSAIIEQAHAVLADPFRRRTYDETLAQAQVQTPSGEPDAFGAELFYQEGQSQLRERDFGAAVQAFARAAQANADQPDYHAYWGWALFLHQGRGEAGAMAARPHLEDALRIAPESAQAHELAGHVERDARQLEVAVEHFIAALTHGAPRVDLFGVVKELLTRLRRYEDLERECRQLIFRLRDKDAVATVPLWVDLSYLYLQHLDRLENARVAVGVAAKLAPGNPLVQGAVAAVAAAQQARRTPPATPATDVDWERTVEALRQRLLAEPGNLAPLHHLVTLHQGGQRLDEALAAVTLLAHFGQATAAEQQLLQQRAPRSLPHATRPLSGSELEWLRGDEGQSAWLELLELLGPPLSALHPVTLESLGSGELELLADIALPHPFKDIFGYVCQQLGVPAPPLYLSHTLGYVALPLPGDETALVIGQEVVDSHEEARAAFVVARALSCADAGRRHLYARPVADLKDAVLGALSLCRPGMKVGDPDGRVARYRTAIGAREAERPRLTALVGQLAQEKKINLSEWRRTVRRSSARVALLVAADLGAALSSVREEPEVNTDLLEFALTPSYFALRHGLGVAG